MLMIAPEKVATVIVRARELGAKVGSWDGHGDSRDADTILESRAGDATRDELSSFIDGLNEDEAASLAALMWIGRETFLAEELGEAVKTAMCQDLAPLSAYLLREPMLADYLEDGLEALGISVEDAEKGIL